MSLESIFNRPSIERRRICTLNLRASCVGVWLDHEIRVIPGIAMHDRLRFGLRQ